MLYTRCMSIWKTIVTLEQLQEKTLNTLAAHLGICYTEIGADYLRATMPVDARTHQPAGILHGGASVALAESLGSVGANLCVDMKTQVCVGQEINANHLRPVASGLVVATARPYHVGSRSQVWHVEISDEHGRLVCVSRLTMAVIARG
jgi:1,4-dihydroxy-2-naphthoyl-CoA hydrolase